LHRRTSTPCDKDGGSLVDLAITAARAHQERLLACPLGFFAALLVTLQSSISPHTFNLTQDVTEMADASAYSEGSGGFDLHPFPFWSEERSLGEQLSFHSRFLAVHLWLCDDQGKHEAYRGRYALRAAHNRAETHCSIQADDYQLLRRCRRRRQMQSHKGMRGFVVDAAMHGATRLGAPAPRAAGPLRDGVASIACPSAEGQEAFAASSASTTDAWEDEELATARNKYVGRAVGESGREGSGCEGAGAEWKDDFPTFQKCILVVVLERLQLAPGAAVLDWGSGCGHKLAWAAQLHDIDGIGIDFVGASVRWAREHSVGHFCEVDGRFVEWLPDDYFDAVISYAAMNHLRREDQCRVVSSLAGKLRIVGRLQRARHLAQPHAHAEQV